MHKVQRGSLKIKKDNNKRNGGKNGKNEGNITMSKRLTIPSEFFHAEIPSTKIQKTSRSRKDSRQKKENYGVLDSFHGIFDNCSNIRRSERILNKFTERNSSTGEKYQNGLRLRCANRKIDGIVDQSLTLSSFQEIHSFGLRNSQNDKIGNHRKEKNAIKKSKSIFEEINQLYEKSNQNNFTNIKIGLVDNSTNELTSNYSFCNSLVQQIDVRFTIGQKSILLCKSKLCTEIEKIENLLSGNTKMEINPKVFKINNFYIDEGNNNINWKNFPQSEWVYNTPPRQKIISPKLNNSQLQPAILCGNQKQKQLFEWKSNIKMDICDLDIKNKIVVDHKYMDHTATVNGAINIDVDMQPYLNDEKNENSNRFDFPKPTSLKPHRRAIVNCKESNETRKFKHKLENKNNPDHDMFPNYTETDAKIIKNNTPSRKKRLFDPHSSTLKSIYDLKIDCSSSSNSEEENDFPFLKPIYQESAPQLNFDFKNNPRKIENYNVFRFAHDENGSI